MYFQEHRMERGNYHIRAYLLFIQHKKACNLEIILSSRFDTKISLKDPELVYSRSFEMNWQQT